MRALRTLKHLSAIVPFGFGRGAILIALLCLTGFSTSSIVSAGSYLNCVTSPWLVPCPWNSALDIHGSSTFCVYRSDSVGGSGTSSNGGGGGGGLYFGGGGGGGGISWRSVAKSTDAEVCAPPSPDEPEFCCTPQLTDSKDECDSCDALKNSEKSESSIDLWGLHYYDSYNDIQIAVPGGWLSTARSYSRGAWRMDGTNQLDPLSINSSGLKRIDMSGRIFTQITANSTTYTSEDYILEVTEDTEWIDSSLLLTMADGSWARYRGTAEAGALLYETGFKENTYLIYEREWGDYPETPIDEISLIRVDSAQEEIDGSATPKPLLYYNYEEITANSTPYTLLTSITNYDPAVIITPDAAVGQIGVFYDYDGQGLLQQVLKVDGTRSEYTYDTSSHNLKTKIEYDAHIDGNVSKAVTIDYHSTKLTDADRVVTPFMLGVSAGIPARVASVTNGAGITKTFSGAYNESSGGYYSKITYSNGLITEVWLDDENDLVQRSLNGQVIYNRATAGSVERITTRGNSLTIRDYDEFDQLIYESLPSGRTRSWSYTGELDRMATAIDELETKTTYTYDDTLSIDTPYRSEAINNYDATRSESMTETTADGSLTRATYDYYDALDRRVLSVDALGHATAYTFKEKTRLIIEAKRVDSGILSEDAVRYTQTFDDLGYLSSRTDANGNVTEYEYDASGRFLSMTDALDYITEYEYSGKDLVKVTTGKSASLPGRVTRYAYDGAGNRATEFRVDAFGTEYRYMSYAYDPEGNLTSTTNADGLTTTYGYDIYGHRDSTSIPLPATKISGVTALNAVSTQEWNAFGDLTETTNVAGLITRYTYDSEGRLSSSTEEERVAGDEVPQTRSISYRYDALGNMTESIYTFNDGTSYTSYTTYDGFGRRTGISGYGVYPQSYSYDANDNLLKTTNAKQLVTRYEYDAFDRTNKVYEEYTDDSESLVSTLVAERSYDSNGNLIKAIDAVGDFVQTAYDALNRAVYHSIPLLSGSAAFTSSWWVADANVSQSTTYDRFGAVTEVKAAHGERTINTYDDYGRLDTVTLPTGVQLTYVYTGADLLKRIEFPAASVNSTLGSQMSYTYDSLNPSMLVSGTNRSGETVAYTYDAALRRARVDLPTGAILSYAFDGFGRLASQSDYESEAKFDTSAMYRTTEYTAYDDFDRLLTLTLPGGEGTQHSGYDEYGNLVMRYGFEADGITQGGNTYPVVYDYDEVGNLETLTTYQGGVDEASSEPSVTTWEYDLRGRLERKVYADTSDVDYTYYDNNRLATRTDARQQLTTYSYDAWGNPDLINYDESAETDIDFSYIKGRRESMTDASGATTWTYHPNTGLPATETRTPLVGDATTVGWAYDDEGRRVEMTVDGLPATHQSGQWQTIYNYDRYGRLQLVQDDRAHSIEPFTYSYASGTGLLEQIDSPWRTGSGTDPYLRQTRAHDNFGRLTDIATFRSSSTDIASQSVTGITYDKLNRRTDLSLLGGTLYASQESRVYDYDHYGQLSEEQTDSVITQAYEYDPIGNRLNWWEGDPASTTPTTYTPDALNQYADVTTPSAQVITPDYDFDGNLQSDSSWTYTWNTENQLLTMEPVGTEVEGDERLTFTYDGLGRRVTKVVETYTSSVWSETSSFSYTYDGWNMIAEVSQKDLQTSPFTLLTSYTWGLDLSGSLQGAGGVGGLLAVAESKDSGSLTYMPSYDFNGNVMGYFETVSETLVAEFEYGPFGELIDSAGSKEDDFNFRFSTKYEDAETGLLYYGYRYYHAGTGRWLSRDPIGERGGLNLYGMVGNNAIGLIDVFGLRGIALPRVGTGASISGSASNPAAIPEISMIFSALDAGREWYIGDTLDDIVGTDVDKGIIDKGAIKEWIEGGKLHGDALARALRVRRCRKAYKKYKNLEKNGTGCKGTDTCEIIDARILLIRAQMRGRDNYKKLNCDDIPWGGKITKADHSTPLEQLKDSLGKCLNWRTKKKCPCPYEQIFGKQFNIK